MPYCCNPLTVAKGSKLRLILDLRHVNKYVRYCPIKYEDWGLLEQVVQPGDYFISFDLTAGYHHVSILPDHRKYLSFSYPNGNLKKFYVFKQMPFGLSCACYLFTKLMRPLVKLWRSKGIRSFIYIDDGIGAATSLRDAEIMSHDMKRDLQFAGFLINQTKSNWDLAQHLSWLGFEFDSNSMVLQAKDRKICKLIEQCAGLLQARRVSPRQVAAVVGQLLAMQRAVGPEVRIRTRYLHFWIDDALNQQLPGADPEAAGTTSGLKRRHSSNVTPPDGSKHRRLEDSRNSCTPQNTTGKQTLLFEQIMWRSPSSAEEASTKAMLATAYAEAAVPQKEVTGALINANAYVEAVAPQKEVAGALINAKAYVQAVAPQKEVAGALINAKAYVQAVAPQKEVAGALINANAYVQAVAPHKEVAGALINASAYIEGSCTSERGRESVD